MENASRNRLLKNSTLGAATLLALALLVIVNYLGGKYYQRFDWTSSDLYTLSGKSLQVVEALGEEVEAVVLVSPGDPLYDPIRELLERYDAASQKLSARYVDPEKNLAEARSLADRFDLSQLDVVVFSSGEDKRIVDTTDLAEYDYSGLQFGQGAEMTGFKGEQVFTSTLLDLTEAEKPKILFTTGHGELDLSDFGPQGLQAAREALEADNFIVESWSSLGQTAVPDGVALVVVAGPTAGFAPPEIQVLDDYLARGGRLLALLDPSLSAGGGLDSVGLESLLADWGVEVGSDIVIDPANPLPFYGAETIFVESYGSHPITRSLDQSRVPVILPLARSISEAETADGFEITELLLTTGEGWGETDLENLQQVAKDDADLEGPVSIAVAVRLGGDEESEEDGEGEDPLADSLEELAAEATGDRAEDDSESAVDNDRDTPTDETRLAVFGDSEFTTNGQISNVGNGELFLNTINWLTERENLVGIAVKKPEQVRLSLSSAQLRNVTLLVFVVLPGLAVLTGAAVFFRRRR